MSTIKDESNNNDSKKRKSPDTTINVNVKWGKQKFDNVEVSTAEPPLAFKSQLFSLTGVPPERQKIMVKGGMLKDDADWSTLGIKDGHTFMMMGSAEEIPKGPIERPVFVEDLAPSDVAMAEFAGYPAGLENLQNTCYMNATLQCLKGVPELQSALKKYPSSHKEGDIHHNLTVSMKDLFTNLDHSPQSIPPNVFLQVLRTAYPQFAQKANNVFMQQDAEECYNQILVSLGQRVPKVGDKYEDKHLSLQGSAIGQLFGGETISTVKNSENAEEPSETKKEAFTKLSCHITASTNFLSEGLKASMEEQLTKRSESLGRECVYVKSSKISKLPYYLSIQFVRFFWKADKQVKAKIARPVEFPMTLDVYDMCTEELKQVLAPNRKKMLEIEDKKLQEYTKKMKENKGKKEEVKKDTKKVVPDTFDPAAFHNDTGMYELFAVLTHKGRMADSGHYVAWVKEDEDKWLKFDDDIVSAVNNEEIKKLSGKGGSDWHTAYLCFYRSKKLEEEPVAMETTATTTTTQ